MCRRCFLFFYVFINPQSSFPLENYFQHLKTTQFHYAASFISIFFNCFYLYSIITTTTFITKLHHYDHSCISILLIFPPHTPSSPSPQLHYRHYFPIIATTFLRLAIIIILQLYTSLPRISTSTTIITSPQSS